MSRIASITYLNQKSEVRAMEKGPLGIVRRGPIRRRRLHKPSKDKKKPEKKPKVEKDPLASVEKNLITYRDSLEKAINKTNCATCREMLNKIKLLSIEKQVEAVPELRRFMDLAKSGTDSKVMEEELQGMPTLLDLIEG